MITVQLILAIIATVTAAFATAYAWACHKITSHVFNTAWSQRHAAFDLGRTLGDCEAAHLFATSIENTVPEALEQVQTNLKSARRAAIRAGFGSHLERTSDDDVLSGDVVLHYSHRGVRALYVGGLRHCWQA